MKTYPKVSELNQHQKGHLAWRLDHKTAVGYLTACRIARGEGHWADTSIYEVFRWAYCSQHSAKINARKVVNFKL